MAAEFREGTVTQGGKVVAFPLAARAGDIDRCARELDLVQGVAAVHYWKTECKRLAEQLSGLGLREEEIRREIMAFQAEVQFAMAQRYEVEAPSNSRAAIPRDHPSA